MPASAAKSGEKAASGSSAKVTQADLAPNAPDQYTVVKGDTLWGIAGRFLKDPWKWPQIWQMNREQIRDPHWIYPGDIIKLDRTGDSPSLSLVSGGGGSGGTSADAAANVVRLEPRTRIETLQEAIPSIPGAAIAPFLTQPRVVEEDTLALAPTIVATEESRVIIGAGDIAYADRIGSEHAINWQVFRQGTALHDPETNELLGYEAKYVGDVRVRRFGAPTTIEVTKARQEIHRGDRLAPAREAAFPTYMPRSPGKPIKGVIMSVDGGVSELGQYQIVTLNRGARDGIEVGHVLAIYRRGQIVQDGRVVDDARSLGMGGWHVETKPNPVVPEPPAAPAADGTPVAAPAGGPIKLPDERTGLMFVFRVFEKMSYGMVMRTTRPIYVGDIIQTP
jgi:hypothetical protein